MTAVYVQNQLSHSALGFKTPEVMFTEKKPDVSHLKIFVENPGPISKTSWSVFDQAKSLSFLLS
jgi:hypothetical protein